MMGLNDNGVVVREVIFPWLRNWFRLIFLYDLVKMVELLFKHFQFSLFLFSFVLPLHNLLNLILLHELLPDFLAVLFFPEPNFFLGQFVLEVNVFFLMKLFEHVLLDLFFKLLFDLLAGR